MRKKKITEFDGKGRLERSRETEKRGKGEVGRGIGGLTRSKQRYRREAKRQEKEIKIRRD